MVWVFGARYLLVRPDRFSGKPAPWSFTFLLGWAGMRGVVTLAAAFLIPERTQHREVLLMVAFTVVAGTLLAARITLRTSSVPARISIVIRVLRKPTPMACPRPDATCYGCHRWRRCIRMAPRRQSGSRCPA